MRRVVITGIGLVTPLGIGTDVTWQGLLAGKSGVRPIEHFDASKHDTRFAGTVPAWDATRFVEKRKLKEMGRYAELTMGAGLLAWDDAGMGELPERERDAIACIVGTGMGGLEIAELSSTILNTKGPGRISPYFVLGLIPNMGAGHLAMRLGLRGPNFTPASACASGGHAIGEAMRMIRHGEIEAALTGGAEATVTPLGVAGFNAMKALSTRNEEPEKASRPFDKDRTGFVLGEGAGLLVIEEYERAKKRGAKIYAELVGYGASDDAFHVTQPAVEGEGAQRAMARALADARMSPSEVGYVNAHGTSTGLGDLRETEAIKSVFGAHARAMPVSSTKSMTGHTLGAAGGIETAIAALCVHHGAIPPTINLDAPGEGCDLDYVPHTARDAKGLSVVMSNSFGFGGTNVALIVRKA